MMITIAAGLLIALAYIVGFYEGTQHERRRIVDSIMRKVDDA